VKLESLVIKVSEIISDEDEIMKRKEISVEGETGIISN